MFAVTLANQVQSLEEEKEILKKKCQSLEEIIAGKNEMISRLKSRLRIETFKCGFFAALIANHTDIKLPELYNECEDGLHVHNYKNDDFRIYVHSVCGTSPNQQHESASSASSSSSSDATNNQQTSSTVVIAEDNKQHTTTNTNNTAALVTEYRLPGTTKRGKKVGSASAATANRAGHVFRSIKSQAAVKEEDVEEKERRIKDVDEKRTETAKVNKITLTDCTDLEKTIRTKIQNITGSAGSSSSAIRATKKDLDDLCRMRIQMLGKYTVEEYAKFLQTHVKSLESIVSGRFVNEEKAKNIVSAGLTTFERRLIFYHDYYNIASLDADHIQRLRTTVRLSMRHTKTYKPFELPEVCRPLQNYTMALFDVSELLSWVLHNPYGFQTIVYLPVEKSSDDDSFSYYILDQVDAHTGVRKWRMACRLLEFSTQLSDVLLRYSIEMFRRIYHDIYKHNRYTENYTEEFPITRFDCRQLVINIINLARKRLFCDILRDVVKKHCTIRPTPQDKFNFQSDDSLNRTEFQKIDDNEYVLPVVQRLFDQADETQASRLMQLHFPADK